MNDAILAAIVLAPLALTYILKSNAALAFLAMCAGYALQSFSAGDIKSLFNLTAKSFVSTDTISAVLIIAPLVITLFLCRGPNSRSPTKPKVFLNLLTALAAGGTLAIMAVSYFDYVGGTKLTSSALWSGLARGQSEIIGAAAVLSLIMIWFSHSKISSKHHK